jgi:hypothetical protein
MYMYVPKGTVEGTYIPHYWYDMYMPGSNITIRIIYTMPQSPKAPFLIFFIDLRHRVISDHYLARDAIAITNSKSSRHR